MTKITPHLCDQQIVHLFLKKCESPEARKKQQIANPEAGEIGGVKIVWSREG